MYNDKMVGGTLKLKNRSCCEKSEMKICENNWGFYFCKICDVHGPYQRESIYYKTREVAESELESYKSYCKLMNGDKE